MSETERKGKFKTVIRHQHGPQLLNYLSNTTLIDEYSFHISKCKKAFAEQWKGSHWQPIYILADLCAYTEHRIAVETTNCGPTTWDHFCHQLNFSLFSTDLHPHSSIIWFQGVQIHPRWCQGFVVMQKNVNTGYIMLFRESLQMQS